MASCVGELLRCDAVSGKHVQRMGTILLLNYCLGSMALAHWLDDTQTVAESYKAVCTPDFFGYNAELELLYRGRFDDRKTSTQMSANSSDLFKGMIEIARTGKPPLNQIPSVGCSIKWRGSEQ